MDKQTPPYYETGTEAEHFVEEMTTSAYRAYQDNGAAAEAAYRDTGATANQILAV